MTPAVKFWPLGDVAALLPGLTSYLASRGIPKAEDGEEPTPGDIAIGAFALDDQAIALEFQRRVQERQAILIGLGVGADIASLGPTVRPDRPGCIACLAKWMQTPWSEAGAKRPLVKAVLPWADAFQQAVCEAVTEAVCAARELHDSERDGGQVRFLKSNFRSWSTHRFMPHPNCTFCGQLEDDATHPVDDLLDFSPQAADGNFRTANPALTTPALMEAFVDPRCGFIKSIVYDTASPLHPVIFAPFASDDRPDLAEIGVGRTGTRQANIRVAILEALERFAGYRPRGRRTVVRGSYAELAPQAVNPRAFVLHDAGQASEPGYQLAPYSDDARYNWVWAYSFRRGRAVLVPEQLAYYNLGQPASGVQDRFVYELSNGCAMGSSLEEAALFGLFELVERDAYLTTWYGRLPGVRLDLSQTGDARIGALVARLEGAGLEPHVFDIGCGLSLPCVAAFLQDNRPDAPAAIISAAGAHLDPLAAINSALTEACTMMVERSPAQAAQMRARGAELVAHPQRVQTAQDHEDQCRSPDILPRLSFLLQPGAAVALEERFASAHKRDAQEVDLGAVLMRLANDVMTVASDILVVDQSFAVLDRFGLRCVKVLAPGLHPMTFGHQYRRISAARIASARRARDLPLDDAASTPLPHTFP